MSTFIVRIELHPSDPEQSFNAVHDAMARAGFSRIYQDPNGQRYHLPSFEYCLSSTASLEALRDTVHAAVTKATSHFMLLISETTRIAVAGLVPVKEAQGNPPSAERAA